MALKCPYTYPLRSRKAKVDYICGIGGYSDGHERWPVEFNASASGEERTYFATLCNAAGISVEELNNAEG